jgi:nanoRNase/pAp phosphatase (c-di-AMP/oligoRNAs hydrolase)
MARRGADPEASTRSTAGLRRSDRFLIGLHDYDRIVLVSHVNPDPDALGSMIGLAHLVETRIGKPTLRTRDGIVGRAENRAMVEALELELTPIEDVDWRDNDAIVMVDSQPNTGRHSFSEDLPVRAVIDHHDTPGDVDAVDFVDIRANYGATCSVVTKYLIEQEVPIPENVATALLYGIETEVTGYPREAGPGDDDALIHLYPLADKDLIAQIRNARLPHSHFEVLLQALQSSFIYDRLIISWVDELPQPEQAAEVVDFMIRFEKVDWAVCGGVCGGKLVLSVRAAIEGAEAGTLLRQVVGKLGRAGGHERRAGGCIPLASTAKTAVDELQGDLRRRLLKALKIDETRGQRLVPLREMLEHLQS